jgi:serine/threonine protein kinase
MTPSPANLADLRAEILEQTHLGKAYRARQRFCDRYDIRRLLGRGGFGVTFLARDMNLPGTPHCVIKQLCPKVREAAMLEKARQRFEQEAKTLGQLCNHPHVPHLLNYFELDGEFYLVQEYIHGLTLSKQMRRAGKWSEETAKIFLQRFLPILGYVHQHQVIHRDVKPSNILYSEADDRLVLIDFGAVKERIMKVDPTTCLTFSTQFVGTVGFAPPEQLAMRPVFASDIYALGMTCLYLMTGKPPLEFEYDGLTGEVRWRSHLEVSEYFGRILDRMLKTSLKERYQSAEEVLRALELESHFAKLMPCMNNQPLAPIPEPPRADPKEYISPLMRTAIAIREWQARLEAKRLKDADLHRHLTEP